MVYVIVQFSAILFLLTQVNIDQLNTATIGLISLSVIIGLTALVHMHPKNLNIVPELKPHHQLITHGIYRYIRHPMYTAVILLCLALMLSNNTWLTQLVMLILVVDLWFKSRREEALLSERFPHYQQYRARTGRFLPFL